MKNPNTGLAYVIDLHGKKLGKTVDTTSLNIVVLQLLEGVFDIGRVAHQIETCIMLK